MEYGEWKKPAAQLHITKISGSKIQLSIAGRRRQILEEQLENVLSASPSGARATLVREMMVFIHSETTSGSMTPELPLVTTSMLTVDPILSGETQPPVRMLSTT